MSYIIGGLTLPVTGEAITQTSVSGNFEKVVSTSASAMPGPLAATNPPTGQLWYDTTNSLVKVNTGTPAAPVWTAVSSVTAGLISGSAAQDYQKAALTPTARADGVAALVEGDMWYDTANDALYIWNGATWVATGASTGIISGTAAQDYQKGTATPTLRADGVASLVEGDMWYHTGINTLLIWDGAVWIATGSITGVVSGTAAQDYQKGAATPTLRADGVAALVESDLWYDTTTDSLYTWNGTSWIATGPKTGIISGTAAQDYQKAPFASVPTTRADGVAALVEGDMWYDTTNDALRVWNGISWIATGPTTGIISGTAAQDYQKGTVIPTTRADGVAALVESDLWYDSANDLMKVWDGTTWLSIGGSSVTTSATAPTSPAPKNGDLWYNSDSTVARGFVYYGGVWVDFSPASGGGGAGATTGVITGTAAQDYQKGTATPTLRADGVASLVEGDLWYDTTNDALKVWNGTAWPASGAGPTTGLITGTAAQDYQKAAFASAPTTRSAAAGGGVLVEGDMWYDTTNDSLSIWDGTAWKAVGSAASVTVATSAPASPSTGALWYNDTTGLLQIWNSTAWKLVNDWIVVADTAPAAPFNGQVWYDSLTNFRAFVWSSTAAAWVDLSPAGGGSSGPTTGVITGTAAQDYQVAAAAPGTRSAAAGSAALQDGDQWFDTTNNALMIRKTGVWIDIAVARVMSTIAAQTIGAVGTYVTGVCTTPAVASGGTTAGANIRVFSFGVFISPNWTTSISQGALLSGTWRLMANIGQAPDNVNGGNAITPNLWLRIA